MASAARPQNAALFILWHYRTTLCGVSGQCSHDASSRVVFRCRLASHVVCTYALSVCIYGVGLVGGYPLFDTRHPMSTIIVSAGFSGLIAIFASVCIERFGGRLGGLLGSLPTTIIPASIGFWLAATSTEEAKHALYAVPPGMIVTHVSCSAGDVSPPIANDIVGHSFVLDDVHLARRMDTRRHCDGPRCSTPPYL